MKKFDRIWNKFLETNQDLIMRYDDLNPDQPISTSQYDAEIRIGNTPSFESTQIMQQALMMALELSNNFIDNIKAAKETLEKDHDTDIIRIYLKEVDDIHIQTQDNIEFIPENKDLLIRANLCQVIHIAKRYRGLGVPFQDLISAGNIGLLNAFDKFDPERAKLRDNLLKDIENIKFPIKYNRLCEHLDPYFKYGDIKKKFIAAFDGQKKGIIKEELLDWVNNNVTNAKFSSVCAMWIRAAILAEIDNNSRIVRREKSDIDKERKEKGSYQKEKAVYIDEPVNAYDSDNNISISDILPETDELPDRNVSDIERSDQIRQLFYTLMEGLSVKSRSILLKKYGVGYPRPWTTIEISSSENMSAARISQVVLQALRKMRENAHLYGIEYPDL